jgi:prolyl-tRNA editing enzyme YbaK/EbsC (Cys-tRNA(Pro) deacylase)
MQRAAREGGRVNPVDRVRSALAAASLSPDLVRELPADTRTAEGAAKAVGAPVGSIVKSLVFLADDAPILALVAGDRRADVKRLREILCLSKKRLRIAQPAEVQDSTGFEPGGVPPVGHSRPMRTLVDRSLSRYDTVWAAAGSGNAVFPLSLSQLVDITHGEVVDFAEALADLHRLEGQEGSTPD